MTRKLLQPPAARLGWDGGGNREMRELLIGELQHALFATQVPAPFTA